MVKEGKSFRIICTMYIVGIDKKINCEGGGNNNLWTDALVLTHGKEDHAIRVTGTLTVLGLALVAQAGASFLSFVSLPRERQI